MIAILSALVFHPIRSIINVESLEDRVDAVVASSQAEGRVLGVTLSVVDHGQIVLNKQYGESDIVQHRKVAEDSVFPLASCSKQFTAAAVLLLQQDGKLNVDDKVSKYLPQIPNGERISIRQLLSHTSGYHDWYPLDFADSRLLKPITEPEIYRGYCKTLDFEPGSYYSYSNTGYYIAAKIAAKVSGEPLFSFLQRRVLTPLGMTHTVIYATDGKQTVKRYYQPFRTGLVESPQEDPSWTEGSTEVMSTASDMAKWNASLLSNSLLNSASTHFMFADTTLTSGVTSAYGMGLYANVVNGHRLIGHEGALQGCAARTMISPETGTGYFIATNQDLGEFKKIAAVLDDAIAGRGQGTAVPTDSPNAHPRIQVHGPAATATAKNLFRAIQAENLVGFKLGPEMKEYVNPTRLTQLSKELRNWGEVTGVSLEYITERGQLEVAAMTMTFENHASVNAFLYRQRDGTVSEFLFQ